MVTKNCYRWVDRALNPTVGTKQWPWGLTEKILFTLGNVHSAYLSLLSIPRLNMRHYCDRFIHKLPNTIAWCSQLTSQKLIYFSSPPNPNHTGPRWVATTNAWEPNACWLMLLQTLRTLLTQAFEERVKEDREVDLSWVIRGLRFLETKWGK